MRNLICRGWWSSPPTTAVCPDPCQPSRANGVPYPHFAGSGGFLSLGGSDLNASGAFVPTIKGFNATDTIDYGGTVTSAQYASGVLSLYDGTSLVATLNIGSGYKNVFSAQSIGNGSQTQINYLGGGAKPAPPGTTSADSYVWTGPVAGYWNSTANWDDTTAGQNPATLAPGANDTVSIGAAANGATQILIGNGNAYGLSLAGSTVLDGQFSVGAGGVTVSSGSLLLHSGSSMSDAGDATLYGQLSLSGAKMTVSGTLYGEAFYGGLSGVTVTGGTLTAGAIVGIQTIFNLTSSTTTVNGNVSAGSSGYYNDPFSEYNVSGGSFTVKGAFISCGDRVNATNGAKVRFSTLQQDARDFGVYLTTDGRRHVAMRKSEGDCAIRIFKQPRQPHATYSSPRYVARGVIALT